MTDELITNSFRTPLGWRSGHLQTIRNRVIRRTFDLDRGGTTRSVLVDLNDGTGDQLAVQLHRSRRDPIAGSDGGLVVLIHGLGGSAESSYIRASTLGLLRAGFNVARVDLRGAGLSGETCSLLYHAGRTEDIRAVLTSLATEPEARQNPTDSPRLALMGFSLGGSMTIKLLGEPHDQLPLFGAVAVSAPLDLPVGRRHLERMAFGMYERFLVIGLKGDALRPGPHGSLRVNQQERVAVERARTLAEFDDAITAPRNGWRDAAEYYEVNSSGPFLSNIDLPTLVVHSLDDPMIPSDPYRAIDWARVDRRGFVERLITPHGGHVGFHERGNPLPWFVGKSAAFLGR